MEQTRGATHEPQIECYVHAARDRECDCRAFVGAAYAIFWMKFSSLAAAIAE